MSLAAALTYAERHGLRAAVVLEGHRIVAERGDPAAPFPLYSGTKSFWGVLAVALAADGRLDLDEPVGRTLPGWTAGPKAAVTLRQLLQLTAGVPFGGLGRSVPSFARAVAVELAAPPGERFTYGGIPLQIAGAVAAARGCDAHALLRERILEPIGLTVASWRRLADGTCPLPTGASLAAREWLKFGRLVRDRGIWAGRALVPASALASCFTGSGANPRYGLGWWLSPLPELPDAVYASGAGGQGLYVVPSRDLVAVMFRDAGSFKHDVFLRRLAAA